MQVAAACGQFLIPEYDDHHIFPRVKRNARPQGAVFLESVQSCLPRFYARAVFGGIRGSPWPVFWIASVAVFLVSLDATLRAAFGALRAGFPQASAADMSWVLNGYTVVYAAMLIPSGGLADAYGRKRMFLTGVALFLAASAACGRRRGLAGGRARGAGGRRGLADAGVAVHRAGRLSGRAAVAVSLWGAVAGLAAAVGPSLGAFVVDAAGWPWAFYINVPLGALSLARRAPAAGIGAARVAAAPGRGGHGPLDPGRGRGGAGHRAVGVAGVVGRRAMGCRRRRRGRAAAFVAWARVAPQPLVDLALFQHRSYRYANLATLSFGIAFAMMFFAFFFYMMGVWHYSLPKAGLAVTPGPLLVMPTAIVTGRLAARMGHRPFLVGGALLYAGAGLWFLLVPGAEPDYLGAWLPGLVLSGLSVGMVLPSLAGAAVSRLPAQHYAVGSAVNQATRQIGAVLGVAITVLLLKGALSHADFDPLYIRGAGVADGVAVPGGGHEADRDARRKAGALRRASARRALVRHERRHGFAGDQLPEGGQEALRPPAAAGPGARTPSGAPRCGRHRVRASRAAARRWRWRERARARPAGGGRRARMTVRS